MKRVQFFLIYFFVSLFCVTANAQSRAKILSQDLTLLVGNWYGSLTYLDYSTGKPYTMPANIRIKNIGNTNKYIFENIYPDEPKANSVDTISISKNGDLLGKEKVQSIKNEKDKSIEIITEELGKDGNENKPASIRITYTFGPTSYTKRKDVRFVGESKWIKRHEYSYTRKDD